MSLSILTIAYTNPDETTARQLADDLAKRGYPLGDLDASSVLILVVSPDNIEKDRALQNTIYQAVVHKRHFVVVETASIDLPSVMGKVLPIPYTPISAQTISFQEGYNLPAVIQAIETIADLPVPLTSDARNTILRQRNRRFGLIFGGVILVLFVFYLWAIAVFDIEAPVEEFERAYTHSAATVGMFAQPFVPRTTLEAENFETTLRSRQISNELATVIVGTVTQAATEGGFTPIPTGLIINPAPISEVRQLATESAILRATQTAQGEQAVQENIAATATQAALDAASELESQLLTVTAAAE